MHSSIAVVCIIAFGLATSADIFAQDAKVPTPVEWIAPRLKLHDIELQGSLTVSNPSMSDFQWTFELLEKREKGVLKYRSILVFVKESKLVLAQITTPDRVIFYAPTGRSLMGNVLDQPHRNSDEGLLRIFGPAYVDPELAARSAGASVIPVERQEALKQIPSYESRFSERELGFSPIILAASLGFDMSPLLLNAGDFRSTITLLKGELREKSSSGVLDIATPFTSSRMTPSGRPQIKTQHVFLLDSTKDLFPLEIRRVTLPEQGDYPAVGKPQFSFVRSEPKLYHDAQGSPFWFPVHCVWGGGDTDQEGKIQGEPRVSTSIKISSAKFNHDIPANLFEYSAIPIRAFPVRVEARSEDIDLKKELASSCFTYEKGKLTGLRPTP